MKNKLTFGGHLSIFKHWNCCCCLVYGYKCCGRDGTVVSCRWVSKEHFPHCFLSQDEEVDGEHPPSHPHLSCSFQTTLSPHLYICRAPLRSWCVCLATYITCTVPCLSIRWALDSWPALQHSLNGVIFQFLTRFHESFDEVRDVAGLVTRLSTAQNATIDEFPEVWSDSAMVENVMSWNVVRWSG